MGNAVNNRQKRLAIFVPDMSGGGAQRVAMNLCRGISDRGYMVDLVLVAATGPFLAEIPDSVRLVDLGAPRTLVSLPALIGYLRHEQPAAMVSFLHYANITAVWARRLANFPKRLVVTEHNTFSTAIKNASGMHVRLMPLLIRRFYPWADGVVAVSKGVANDLSQKTEIPRKSIQVIYNPVVTPQLRNKAQAPLEHQWFGDGKPPVILGVGRLTVQKDFETLIKAFARVRQTRTVRLLILGEGEERPHLEHLVRQLSLEEDVRLPGYVPNPYPYMAGASMFILSSRWEGLPTVLIEALYCGISVVSTDCPSGPREILQDGQFGQLVAVGDTLSLAQAIEASLAGKTPRPSPEIWRPFELETVVDHYVRILFGE